MGPHTYGDFSPWRPPGAIAGRGWGGIQRSILKLLENGPRGCPRQRQLPCSLSSAPPQTFRSETQVIPSDRYPRGGPAQRPPPPGRLPQRSNLQKLQTFPGEALSPLQHACTWHPLGPRAPPPRGALPSRFPRHLRVHSTDQVWRGCDRLRSDITSHSVTSWNLQCTIRGS